MTQGTIQRLRKHGIHLAQVSAYHASDCCIRYENASVSIGPQPQPVYPPGLTGGDADEKEQAPCVWK